MRKGRYRQLKYPQQKMADRITHGLMRKLAVVSVILYILILALAFLFIMYVIDTFYG